MSTNTADLTGYHSKNSCRQIEDYADIITHPRPRTTSRPLSITQRATQFAPYATLSGHQELIARTEQHTLLANDPHHQVILDPASDFSSEDFSYGCAD